MAKLSARTPVKSVPAWRRLSTELRVPLLIALLGGAVAGIATSWEQFFPVPADHLVRIYRTHGCRCAFPWAKMLESEGFVVRMFEPESLEITRTALHTPESLRGCHVAEFMGYFIEGHVPVSAIRRLSAEHPLLRGIAVQSSATGSAERLPSQTDGEPVLLFDQTGTSRIWVGAQSHDTND